MDLSFLKARCKEFLMLEDIVYHLRSGLQAILSHPPVLEIDNSKLLKSGKLSKDDIDESSKFCAAISIFHLQS